ncbi:signal recognition particle subunit SRP72 KNAG_0D01080 [Huiozyma naganishii CBS 8797]|uniref:Signal recognition particle subunit SRP72 n=1 Tax=Huiozyma naganishii (strain ATCC MYA-139 / BCRC 22969 / CBS 8797 / KCTC 17520 / NBRC 10181 / NCYC 3082 / Yp74L-3) TaxID=1071383 RepID=J7R4U1_HUIN7|nr:hypothetical protein KNAG_0D01080 [Kazachstania naganishii CBS 8797]CCK69860.1 hypothetical protein KNAG_0D01080 [Kazachstania naganishii CBS 8797]
MVKNTLTDLLKQLDVQSAHNEHSRVEKTCIELLGDANCQEPEVMLKKCLISLIKQDKYQRALSLLNKYSDIADQSSSILRLEVLYIYYKLNNRAAFEKLYKTVGVDVDALGSGDSQVSYEKRGVLHVRAQFCLKNGKSKEASKLYAYLATTNNNEKDNLLELACNERVPLTFSAESHGLHPIITDLKQESYDLMFNESFIFLMREQYEEAINLLEKALSLAVAEGFEMDINTIELQLSYVLQVSGIDTEKAKAILKQLLEKSKPGTPLYLVAQNNLESFKDISKKKSNMNLLLRELNLEKINSLNLKNFNYQQWDTLQKNLHSIRLYNGVKLSPTNSIWAKAVAKYSELVNDVLNEPYKTQAKKLYNDCAKLVKSCPDIQTNKGAIGTLLVAIELLSVEKEYDNAIRLGEAYLNRFEILELNPQTTIVVIYILLELYSITNRNKSRGILLDRVARCETAAGSTEFWKHIGFQYLRSGEVDNAKNVFETKIENSERDPLINTLLGTENEQQKDEFDLSKAALLVQNVDAELLKSCKVSPFESSSREKNSNNAVMKANKIKKVRIENRKQKRKEYKLKKFIASHNINTASGPNAERWLPLRDRSTYRPKKKQLAKQTQGGAMSKKAEQSLDISKKVNSSAKGKSVKKAKKKGRK